MTRLDRRRSRIALIVLAAAGLAGLAGLTALGGAPADAAPGTAAPAGKPTTPAAAAAGSPEAEVRARERAWLDAYEQRDPEVMSEVLADGFLITFPDGGQLDKAAVVAQMRRPRKPDQPPPPRFTTRGTVARMRDGVVILIGHVTDIRIDAKGERREETSSYTDTWVREGGAWRVLASHLSRAPVARPAAKPAP